MDCPDLVSQYSEPLIIFRVNSKLLYRLLVLYLYVLLCFSVFWFWVVTTAESRANVKSVNAFAPWVMYATVPSNVLILLLVNYFLWLLL